MQFAEGRSYNDSPNVNTGYTAVNSDSDWRLGRTSASDVKRGDIIALATKTKDPVTVGDIIDDALALQGAMARLMDEYIRLVIREG